MKSFKEFLKVPQTKVGLVFALIVPLLFVVIWMTGYHQATERVDQLQVALVNEDGIQGTEVQEQIETLAPFHITVLDSAKEAEQQMNAGNYAMVIVIPQGFANQIAGETDASLSFYINQGNADVAKSILEHAATGITTQMGQRILESKVQVTLNNDRINNEDLSTAIGQAMAKMNEGPVKAEINKTNSVSDFATSMLPMILGFITYIAAMTMNIQFNITSNIMKRNHSKWEIFWGRQMLLLCIAVIVPLIVDIVALQLTDVASSFGALYLYHVLVSLACICFTQMSFALFGNAGPLFNVAMVPLQLMTAGNIIPAEMLAPFYRYIGNFLPASNGVQGFMRLIYSGEAVGGYMVHLLLIAVITWGITLLRVGLHQEGRGKMKTMPSTASVQH
ncbi:YhgE/Pip domain-containing protein [Paenibacillus sp. QZ-Y1]|uniref:YhgE/Pip domain-containing protein n=1 Tax=Paenibacillus sp. QZ-Y1 TaxID=3414511 RepID=UPI003F7A52FE